MVHLISYHCAQIRTLKGLLTYVPRTAAAKTAAGLWHATGVDAMCPESAFADAHGIASH